MASWNNVQKDIAAVENVDFHAFFMLGMGARLALANGILVDLTHQGLEVIYTLGTGLWHLCYCLKPIALS